MSLTSVLIVDDSAFMRKMLTEIIQRDSSLSVVGCARDGADALRKAESLKPDVITLDVEMPVMDGYATLLELMRRGPYRVVMVSSLTQVGADITLKCLSAGAIDFVPKPSRPISLDIERVAVDIIAKVKIAAVSQVKFDIAAYAETGARVSEPNTPVGLDAPGAMPTAPQTDPPALRMTHTHVSERTKAPSMSTAEHVVETPARPLRPIGRTHSDRLLVIGASTGGPRALHTLVAGLGHGLDIPGIIVQHMPAGFTQSLAKRLDAAGGSTVREAADGESLEPGTILVAPGGYHLIVRPDATVQLSTEPPIHGVRPSIDVTLESVARTFGPRAIAVLLTGMGKDGARGLKLLRDMGARTFAESESSCVVYGMPKAAFEMHAVETMLPIGELAPAIIAAATHSMNAAAWCRLHS